MLKLSSSVGFSLLSAEDGRLACLVHPDETGDVGFDVDLAAVDDVAKLANAKVA
jgi:hypothetical protein